LHWYGVQLVAAGWTHLPAVLQVEAWMYELPEQDWGAQTVPAA
jgi:hypothetical protein